MPGMWILGNPIKIEGKEFSNERAIYISNHASPIDIFLVMWLTPTSTVGIAKKEIIWYPLFGQLYVLANHLRIDRSNPSTAIQSMKKAVQAVIKHNLSLIIFPEGTRSKNGRLLPFKKGFETLSAIVVLFLFHFLVEFEGYKNWLEMLLLSAKCTGIQNVEDEKQVKFFQGCVASVFAERDHSIMEAEKAKEKEELMSQRFNEFQTRRNDALQINLAKLEEENETLRKCCIQWIEKSLQRSCLEYESEGIQCMHAIPVMKEEHLRVIPNSMLMKLWIINAKDGIRLMNVKTKHVHNCMSYGLQVYWQGTKGGVEDPVRKVDLKKNLNSMQKRKPYNCRICGEVGHNSRKCPTINMEEENTYEELDFDVDTKMNSSNEEMVEGNTLKTYEKLQVF
ncbi:hypothetical protein REPUB_Repub13aG0041900 [Reevesia pubescens]